MHIKRVNDIKQKPRGPGMREICFLILSFRMNHANFDTAQEGFSTLRKAFPYRRIKAKLEPLGNQCPEGRELTDVKVALPRFWPP
jgi:hypothetical protein